MTKTGNGHLVSVLLKNKNELLEGWLSGMQSQMRRRDKSAEADFRQIAERFIPMLIQACQEGTDDIDAPHWNETRRVLSEMSQSRAQQGFSPTDTALFVFSLKEPVFAFLRKELVGNAEEIVDQTALTGALFDKLGLFTIQEYQKGREQIISRQQTELLELSTPVVQLWQNILALPLIGTLDSARTQVVMESLLEKIVETSAHIAIIDITGVPTVDTLVAQHLLKTVAAARLMGADCIISGIRPQIAQTIVHLGVNLEDVITKATLADAFLVALKRTDSSVTPARLEA